MSIVKRIQDIGKENCKSIRAFEILLGKSVGYLKTMENKGGSPGADVLTKITELYPEVNMNWVLSGEGNMYHQREEVQEPKAPYSSITINITDGESSPLIKALEELIKKEKQK